MADGMVISISVEVWAKKLKEYMRLTGISLQETLAEEWPLLIRKMIDFTPPFKTRGIPGSSDLSVGRRAVSHDIYKTMRPFDPAAIKTAGMRRIVERKDIAAFNIVAARARSGFMNGAQAVAFSPSLHKSARDARGRVTGRDRNRVVLGSDVKALQAYVTEEQRFVGVAKSGWAPAYNLTRDPEGNALPSYVSRQDGNHWGAVIDDRANEWNPSVTAINRSPWAVRQDEGERIKAAAFASRAAAISSKIKTKIRLARENAGFNGRAVA